MLCLWAVGLLLHLLLSSGRIIKSYIDSIQCSAGIYNSFALIMIWLQVWFFCTASWPVSLIILCVGRRQAVEHSKWTLSSLSHFTNLQNDNYAKCLNGVISVASFFQIKNPEVINHSHCEVNPGNISIFRLALSIISSNMTPFSSSVKWKERRMCMRKKTATQCFVRFTFWWTTAVCDGFSILSIFY